MLKKTYLNVMLTIILLFSFSVSAKEVCDALFTPANTLEVFLQELPQYEQPLELNVRELLAISMYTEADFIRLNGALREWNKSNILPENFTQADIKATISGLRKLPLYAGVVRRYEMVDQGLLAQIQPGTVINPPSFWSSSKKEMLHMYQNPNINVQYQIKSKRGRDISKISSFPEEEEVLFEPFSYFRVIERSHFNNKILIVLEEL